MKVAVFLYGEYRQFEQSVKLYTKQLSNLSPDYYLATWEDSLEQDSLKTYYVKHKVTEERIKTFLPDAHIKIDVDTSEHFNMCRNIYRLLNNCCDLYEKSNTEYDIVIVKRLHCIDRFEGAHQHLHPKILETYDYNSIYTINGLSDSKSFDFGDLFYYGNPKSIVRFIRAINSRLTEVKKYKGNVHKDPDMFLFYSDFSVKKIPVNMNSVVIRPTADFIRVAEEATEINSELFQKLDPYHSDWYSNGKYNVIR